MMPTTLSRLGSAATAATLALLLAGCGGSGSSEPSDPSVTASTSNDRPSPTAPAGATGTATTTDASALNNYLDAARPQVEAQLKSFGDVYSDFTLTGEGASRMIYSYTYADQVDAAATKASLEGQSDALKSVFDDTIVSQMKAAGVPDPSAEWRWYNADGSLVWSYVAESK